jgi:hypothetical protein
MFFNIKILTLRHLKQKSYHTCHDMSLCGYTQQQKYTSVLYIKVDNSFV